MNAEVESAVYTETAAELSSKGFGLFRAVDSLFQGTVEFFKRMNTAHVVARQARRYYAMSDSQLASAGLRRDQVGAELVRILLRD